MTNAIKLTKKRRSCYEGEYRGHWFRVFGSHESSDGHHTTVTKNVAHWCYAFRSPRGNWLTDDGCGSRKQAVALVVGTIDRELGELDMCEGPIGV